MLRAVTNLVMLWPSIPLTDPDAVFDCIAKVPHVAGLLLTPGM
ncbi:MAG: hypothetical protein QG636_335 [Patescibacteria group bacterium]|nr:hypothetical protein [Patescibacteria group bacterium]